MDAKIIDDELEVSIYCPICQRDIIANNTEEVRTGEHDGFVFVHDDIRHEESDIDALINGAQ